MKVLTIILMFFMLNALLIISNNEIHIFTDKGIKDFSNFYLNWINSFYKNSLEISGHIIKKDWLPQ